MRCLVFVDDRRCSALTPCSLNYALFRRTDIVPILLRPIGGDAFGPEYLEATQHLHRFYVDLTADLTSETNRFRTWCAERKFEPDTLCCMTESLQEYWQAFARQIGVGRIPADVVRALRHKPTMKEWIRRAGLATAEYAEVSVTEDVLHFARRQGYPIVLKPVDGAGAEDTFVLHCTTDVLAHAQILSSKPMMVETFIADREYECSALIARGEVLDVYPSVMPASMLEAANGAMNADISVGGQLHWVPVNDLRSVIQQLVSGFGLTEGYLHLELFASSDGARLHISELALRYPGCEVAKNHGLALGFDIARATIDTYLGLIPELRYTRNRCVGDLMLPYKPGRIRRLSTPDSLRAIPGVIEVHLGVSKGDVLPEVAKASDVSSGWVLIEGADPHEVEQRMQQILDQYMIETEPARVAAFA